MLRADLHCYFCGYVPGQVAWDPSEPERRQFRPSDHGPGLAPDGGGLPRCGRCGGQLYLDEIEVIPTRLRSVVRNRSVSHPSLRDRLF